MTNKRKRKVSFRRKRNLDPQVDIDYKNPDNLRRFITDRGKIIPRRISGASAKQQRLICQAVKRARYLALLPFSLGHRTERDFATEMSQIAASSMGVNRSFYKKDYNAPRGDYKSGEGRGDYKSGEGRGDYKSGEGRDFNKGEGRGDFARSEPRGDRDFGGQGRGGKGRDE
jgi:small subunit ribosomal protein S18